MYICISIIYIYHSIPHTHIWFNLVAALHLSLGHFQSTSGKLLHPSRPKWCPWTNNIVGYNSQQSTSCFSICDETYNCEALMGAVKRWNIQLHVAWITRIITLQEMLSKWPLVLQPFSSQIEFFYQCASEAHRNRTCCTSPAGFGPLCHVIMMFTVDNLWIFMIIYDNLIISCR